MRARIIIVLISLAACCGFFALAATARAQEPEGPWSPPVNLSLSGSASQPVIGIAPNGAAYALWWDQIDGERYARGVISGSQVIWDRSAPVAPIFGDRQQDATTRRVALSPPRGVRLAVDRAGIPTAIWFARGDRLLLTQLLNRTWTPAQPLSEGAIASDATIDISGTLQLAYIQSASTPQSPSGVYYATRQAGQLRRTLVFSSTYFRTSTATDSNVSVTADGNVVVVAWNQLRDEQSLYSRSADGGRTWSPPAPVVPRSAELGAALKVSVAAAPNGQMLLVWRDTSAPGCGFTQRRSTDQGTTWGDPERILPTLSRCPDEWKFSIDDRGVLWILGVTKSSAPLGDSDGLLASWDGAAWSDPALMQISSFDAATQRTRTLGCLESSLAGPSVALIGCDARGDAWSVHNVVPLEQLVPALQSAWSPAFDLSRSIPYRTGAAGTGDIAMAAGPGGRVYAVWGYSPGADDPATSLYASSFANDQWTNAIEVLRGQEATGAAQPSAVKFDAPALAVDGEDRLHMVWSGGPAGAVFYSSAFGRDATTSQGWSRPIVLPAPSSLGATPDIVADPRGSVLHALYAVPFNEGRGVYLVSSEDGGATWSQPVLVFDAVAAGWNGVGATRLALDAGTDSLHATWVKSGVPGSSEPGEVYYARSLDRGRSWSAPVSVADGEVAAPRVVAVDGTVALVWNAARPSNTDPDAAWEVWGQFSPDGGASWTEAARVSGFDQVSGPVSLVGATTDQLYLVGLGRAAGGTASLLFTQWAGSGWGTTESASQAQPAKRTNLPAAAISSQGRLGTVLRLEQLRSDGASVNASLGSARAIAPVELAPLPTLVPAATPSPEPTITPEPTATPEPVIATAVPNQATGSATAPNSLVLAGGLALVVIVIGAVLAFTFFRRR